MGDVRAEKEKGTVRSQNEEQVIPCVIPDIFYRESLFGCVKREKGNVRMEKGKGRRRKEGVKSEEQE